MSSSSPDDAFETLGHMTPERRAAKLAEIEPPMRRGGEPAPLAKRLWGPPKPYEHTAHAFGYLRPGAVGARSAATRST
jgi:hypothetical protein